MTQYNLNFRDELIVDNFAGGGGASIGIEQGAGRYIDIAINHSKEALDVHSLNHPHTIHIQTDVFDVDPVAVCNGKPVGLGWFSPDCRHFSKAKGGQPVEKKIRGLAWVARKWAKAVHPRIIILENVEEFLTWGPIVSINGESKPDRKRAGLTFNAFNSWFIRNGYKTEWKILSACDYGAPTIRKRLFWIARNDGMPIVWPKPTHGPKGPLTKKQKLKPYRTAAECIDFSIPCPSIFMDKEQAKQYSEETGTRVIRPLADATLRRIAKGIVKYVLHEKQPFIVPISNYGSGCIVQPTDEPLRTITAWPRGGSFALCTPYIATYYGQKNDEYRGQSMDNPMATQSTSNRHAVIMPMITRQFGQSIGQGVKCPTGSITAGGMGKTQLVNVMAAPIIGRQFGTGVCHPVSIPLRSTMAGGGGGKNNLISAFLAKHYTGVTGSAMKEPISTITAIDHHSMVEAKLSRDSVESGAERVLAFLLKYYGTNIGHDLRQPLQTITSKDRFGLVTVNIKGEPWVLVDIGIRMLQPEELKLAQGFPTDYDLGNHSKTTKVRLIGNSVCPQLAEALVSANYNNMNIMRESA